MGTYLVTGVVQDITIDKRNIRFQDIKLDNIIERLKDELNLDYYNYKEDEDGYYWKIKSATLEDRLVEFLDIQFEMYEDTKNVRMQETLEYLAKAKNGDEIIALASTKTKTLINFQLLYPITNYIRVMRDNGFDEHVMVDYSLISYFRNGKIIMECYNNILRYFERNIRLQNKKYPIADCVKVMITT